MGLKMSELKREEVLGALARGYCTKENENKTLDSALCNAMADEVIALRSLSAGVTVPREPITIPHPWTHPEAENGGGWT